eukprot:TRINITY_DN24346_c0_g2_i1.p2 TRINITY_DN24346_c0_g2~~TRINITY_DN24346_c0_g2_i1.p2  ORF type:complete len:119 (-),score=9.74 TRINITY_DN24346_c0_g2_i1:71-382(-)
MDAPITLSRCWCVFELSCSIRGACTIEAAPLNGSDLTDNLKESFHTAASTLCVRLEECSAREESDKEMILEHIRNGIGMEATNTRVESALRQTIARLADSIQD